MKGCVSFMVKIAVLGDTESIKGFAAVGLDIYPCDNDTESAAEFKKIVNAGYGVIFVTERLVPFLQKEIEKVNRQLSPSVVPITGVWAITARAWRRLKARWKKRSARI